MQLWSRPHTLPTPQLQTWIKCKCVFVKDGCADNSEKSLCTRNSEKLDFREDIYKLQPLMGVGGGKPQTAEVTVRSGLSRGREPRSPHRAAPPGSAVEGCALLPGLLGVQVKCPSLELWAHTHLPKLGRGEVRHYLKGGSLASNKRCDNPERYSSLENGIMLVT